MSWNGLEGHHLANDGGSKTLKFSQNLWTTLPTSKSPFSFRWETIIAPSFVWTDWQADRQGNSQLVPMSTQPQLNSFPRIRVKFRFRVSVRVRSRARVRVIRLIRVNWKPTVSAKNGCYANNYTDYWPSSRTWFAEFWKPLSAFCSKAISSSLRSTSFCKSKIRFS